MLVFVVLEDNTYSSDACVVIIPSWRHHLVQYDRLSAALEALDVPTAVHPLPDGLWAFLLRRLQVMDSTCVVRSKSYVM